MLFKPDRLGEIYNVSKEVPDFPITCKITSIYVYAVLGLPIVKGIFLVDKQNGPSDQRLRVHHWNLDGEKIIDLTVQQFDPQLYDIKPKKGVNIIGPNHPLWPKYLIGSPLNVTQETVEEVVRVHFEHGRWLVGRGYK